MRTIQARPQSVRELFTGYDEFIIPDFQRPYSWDEGQCNQLWDDLIAFFESKDNNSENYYLGNLVVSRVRDAKEDNIDAEVIDGQQRIATLLILIKALSSHNKKMTILDEYLFRKDIHTGEVDKEKLRLNVAEEDKGHFDEFIKFIKEEATETSDGNRFLKNYEVFQVRIGEWEKSHNAEELEPLIRALLNRVILLLVECDTLSDAITIFETINDRGKALEEVDIYKARLYKYAKKSGKEKEEGKEEAKKFIARWNKLTHRFWLFQVHMSVLRAGKKLEDGDRELRLEEMNPWNTKDFYNNKEDDPFEEWGEFIEGLERHNAFVNKYLPNDYLSEEPIPPEINKWWHVLHIHPSYGIWRFPLYVFFHKYADCSEENGERQYSLSEEKEKVLIRLMEESIRFFGMKNLIDKTTPKHVKRDAFKMCKAIYEAKSCEDCIKYYEEAIDNLIQGKENIANVARFKEQIRWGYMRYIVLLSAYLNPKQSEIIKCKWDREHIRPLVAEGSGHHSSWDNHGEYLWQIGNLIPLESSHNRSASNKSFKEKKKVYNESLGPPNPSIQEVFELAERNEDEWTLDMCKKRTKEIVKRLEDFFLENKPFPVNRPTDEK